MYVCVTRPSGKLYYIAVLQSDDGEVHVYHFKKTTDLMGRILQDRAHNLLDKQKAQALMNAMGIVQ
jgi:hypothetical protein